MTESIAEASFIPLGGIDQWVTIRGTDRTNPVLLIVHGGPGDAQSALQSVYAVYEKDFIVVQWDQRGAGKTYANNLDSPPEPLLVIADGIELAEYLIRHLAKKNILLVGHSWGAYLGVNMAQERPELFAAYIGTGQVGSWSENVRAQFDFMMTQASAANDRKMVARLEAIGNPDPANIIQYFSWWRMRNPYMHQDDSNWFEELDRITKSDPQFTEAYMKTFSAGMSYSGRTIVAAMFATDLPKTASHFKLPFFVIQGREDMVTPTAVAVKYFDIVKAPKKKLIFVDDAGHFAFVTHRNQVLEVLLREIRPLAVGAR